MIAPCWLSRMLEINPFMEFIQIDSFFLEECWHIQTSAPKGIQNHPHTRGHVSLHANLFLQSLSTTASTKPRRHARFTTYRHQKTSMRHEQKGMDGKLPSPQRSK